MSRRVLLPYMVRVTEMRFVLSTQCPRHLLAAPEKITDCFLRRIFECPFNERRMDGRESGIDGRQR